MRDRELKASISVFGGFLTHLVMGAFYLWGNLSMYVVSYYRLNGHPDLELSDVQAVFPFIYVGISAGQFLGIYCARKCGHKLVSGLNMLIYAGSLYVASISNFYVFVAFYGFLPGLCIGNEYLIPLDNAYYYYPKKKGLIGGLILCGMGFGALVFNPLLQYFINPDNLTPLAGLYPPEVANRLPGALQKALMIYLGVGGVGVLMMIQTRNYEKMEKSLSRESETLLGSSIIPSPGKNSEIRITCIKDAFKQQQIYVMWILFFACSAYGFFVVSQYKSFGLLRIQDDQFLAIVGSVCGAANGLSRFMWAALLDHVSPNILMSINILMMIILSGTFDLVASSKPLFMIWMILIYIQYGGLYTYFPTLATRIYGNKFGLTLYNISATSIIFSNFLQFFLSKFFLDTNSKQSYANLFYIFSGIGVFALCLHLFASCEVKAKKTKSINA